MTRKRKRLDTQPRKAETRKTLALAKEFNLAVVRLQDASACGPDRGKRRELPKYPRPSFGLMAGAGQTQQFRKDLTKNGLGYTEVDEMGRPIIQSDHHRRLVARALGFTSKDAFYD